MQRLTFLGHNLIIHPIAGLLWFLGLDRVAEVLHSLGAPHVD